ncbi:MAG: MotA/TolQ/ExbB proton channel family protein [Planctomycetia bacterium]|nr:MotA/TolQ/ExbB proton channel family protein [Planctomycetia bacterium]
MKAIPVRRVLLIVAALLLLAPATATWPARAQSGGAASQPAADAAAESEGATIPDRNLLQIIQSGGILMYPIIFCSFLLLVFVFERFIALRRGSIIPRPFVKRFLHQLRQGQLDAAKALKLCEENDSPVAKVFAGAVRKWGKSSVEVEQAMIDAGERVTSKLRKNLRAVGAIATISPLLGLMGTVFGMIEAFNVIAHADAMGRQELLAGGIAQALLTTAGGLTVAVPAYLFSAFFASVVDRRIAEIDALGEEVVQNIAHDALPESSQRHSRRMEKAA